MAVPNDNLSPKEEIEELTQISQEAGRNKKKKIDLKLIISVACVLGVMSYLFLGSGKSHEDVSGPSLLVADKKEVDDTLAENIRKLEAKKQATQKKETTPKNHDETRETNFTQTLPSKEKDDVAFSQDEKEFPKDCLIAAIVNKEECQAFLARLNAPINAYLSEEAGESPHNNGVNDSSSQTKEHKAVFLGNDANSQFANQTSQVDTVSASTLSHPDFTIVQGEVIQGVLDSMLNSDLPGMIRAHTTQPVYSYTGARKLIPAGTRLVGQYSSGVVQGQRRFMAIWTRAVLPDGTTIQIDSPGSDELGTSGLGADSYNLHFWERFGQASLLSVLGAGASNVGVDSNTEYNSASAYRSALSSSLQDSAEQSLENTISTSPTLYKYQGDRITVFVAHDLSFYEVKKQKAKP